MLLKTILPVPRETKTTKKIYLIIDENLEMDSSAVSMTLQIAPTHLLVAEHHFQIMQRCSTLLITAYGALPGTMQISSVTRDTRLRHLLQENWDFQRQAISRTQRREIWRLPNKFMQRYCAMWGCSAHMQ